MAPKVVRCRRGLTSSLSRRGALATFVAVGLLPRLVGPASSATSVSFGLTPVFLDSDIELLAMLRQYLGRRLGRPIELVKRRTYQEITALLLTGQLDAAWVCDDPYVQHQSQLSLLAVPLYRHEPLYQTYVAVNEASKAQSFDDIRGTVHAFALRLAGLPE